MRWRWGGGAVSIGSRERRLIERRAPSLICAPSLISARAASVHMNTMGSSHQSSNALAFGTSRPAPAPAPAVTSAAPVAAVVMSVAPVAAVAMSVATAASATAGAGATLENAKPMGIFHAREVVRVWDLLDELAEFGAQAAEVRALAEHVEARNARDTQIRHQLLEASDHAGVEREIVHSRKAGQRTIQLQLDDWC